MTPSEKRALPKYRQAFVNHEIKQWNALDGAVKQALRRLLRKRLEQARTPGADGVRTLIAQAFAGCASGPRHEVRSSSIP